jgi:hypothetical protein
MEAHRPCHRFQSSPAFSPMLRRTHIIFGFKGNLIRQRKFFFEKKNQKTFANLDPLWGKCEQKKLFFLLFLEKEDLSISL